MIHIKVQYRVKKDKVEQIEKAIIELVHSIREKERETLLYDAFQSAKDPTEFIHVMSFADNKARLFHESASHTQKFVDILYPCCIGKPEFTTCRLINSSQGAGIRK